LNASRGSVVETNALIRALDNGKVIAAGLDVLENENLKSYTDNEREQFLSLVSRAQVVITPHIAGYSRESLEKMAKVLIFKLDESKMD
jgi:D-3-phosphoglycerate dehydrogenase / 2-oxoglutarate reductase